MNDSRNDGAGFLLRLLLSLGFGLAACADHDSGESPRGQHLRVAVRDNPTGNRPVAGVYVVLHGSDDVSVERTLVTGDDGVADFGDPGRSQVTVTLAWKTGGYPEQDLWTYVDMPTGDVTYFTRPWHFPPDGAVASISVAVPDAPANTSFLEMAPVGGAFNGRTTLNGVDVAPEALQADGKLSLLAVATDSLQVSPQDSVQFYSFLLDQDLVDGGTYHVPGVGGAGAWRAPTRLPWEAAAGDRYQLITIDGYRKGVRYGLGMWVSALATQGTMPFLDAFPVDEYGVMAVSCEEGPRTCVSVTKRFEAIPSVLSFEAPAYGVENASYDPLTRTLGWSFKPGTRGDMLSAGAGGTFGPTFWTANLRPDATRWIIPDLPAPVNEWVGSNPFGDVAFNNVVISVSDFSNVDGFDAWWETYLRRGLDPPREGSDVTTGSASLSVSGQAP